MRLIDEICKAVPELHEHREALELVRRTLEKHGYELSVRYDSASSVTETNDQHRLVRLAVQNGWGGISVLWDLLHELGHVLSGKLQRVGPPRTEAEQQDQQMRELTAWEFARTFIEAHLQHLLRHSDEFEQRRRFCLKAYGVTV